VRRFGFGWIGGVSFTTEVTEITVGERGMACWDACHVYQRSQEGALEGGAVLPHVLANVATLASSQLLLQRSAG